MAKDAGMKYIVITSKHHDGFAMFHSKASPYNIYDATPFKRDPLKELAEACQKQGMRLGFYYSQCQDWHHPGGGVMRWQTLGQAQEGDFDEYLDKVAVPQVKEILTNYGPVCRALVGHAEQDDDPGTLRKLDELAQAPARHHQEQPPRRRLQGRHRNAGADIPATGYPGRDWETCMTMNDTWGFKSDDHNWKSTETLIRNLIDIASKGGNYLLNVGPTAEGLIPAAECRALGGGRPVDESQRRGDLRHQGHPLWSRVRQGGQKAKATSGSQEEPASCLLWLRD